jgi:hypothetical protein
VQAKGSPWLSTSAVKHGGLPRQSTNKASISLPVVVEGRIDPIQPFDNFIEAAVHVVPEIIEPLVVPPGRGGKREHDGQGDLNERQVQDRGGIDDYTGLIR